MRRAAPINITVGSTTTPTPTTARRNAHTSTDGRVAIISITSPADRAGFVPGTTVTVTAAASDSDGSIARVEFGTMGCPVRLDRSERALQRADQVAVAIRLKLYAVAYDDTGNRTQSAPIFIYFEDPRGPDDHGRITHSVRRPLTPSTVERARQTWLRQLRVPRDAHGRERLLHVHRPQLWRALQGRAS